MDWIKSNYEKLLLGLFGVLALVIGGWLSFCAFTGAAQDGPTKVNDTKYEPGKYLTEDTQKALAKIGENLQWNPVKISDHEKARLFVSSPVVEKAGEEPTNILKPDAKSLRADVPNYWLYENDLDLTRDDVLALDTDNDTFTNLEEFQGNTNPRDPSSKPKPYMKLQLAEIIPVPYEIRFSTANGADLAVRRLAPLDVQGKQPGKLNYKIGDVLFDDDKRFKILNVEVRDLPKGTEVEKVEHLILEDTINTAGNPIVIPIRTTLNRPSYTAKVRSSLSGEETITKEGDEIKLPKDFPTIKFRLIKIGEGFIEVEMAEPGKPVEKAKIDLKK